jgi:uncharacterized protein (TIGR02231 family)
VIAMTDPGATAPSPATPGSPTALALDAPITGVVVYPKQARVTRRGAVTLRPAGAGDGREPLEFAVSLGGLPLALDQDSVRVSGRGAVRVLGVDVVLEPRAETADPRLAELKEELRALRRRLRELVDAEAVEQARRVFLDVAARTGAASIGRGLAAPSWSGGPTEGRGLGTLQDDEAGAETSGEASGEARRLAEVSAALGGQLADGYARVRAIGDERTDVQRRAEAAERAIESRRAQHRPDTRRVVVALEATGQAGDEVEVDLEVSYLVSGASWSARYDARLVDGVVTLTWFGMVSQTSGEDWPRCDLVLSTARPARRQGLPTLTPWYVDVARPAALPLSFSPAAALGAAPPPPIAAAPDRATAKRSAVPAPPVEHAVATVSTEGTAATYRPARPVPVPADGRPHRTTLAVLELEAELDYLTVPKLAPEAYLRATVTNTSAHTLLPGPVAIFHDADYVGTSALELVPPGAEVELQLGVDDRLLVERELTSRETSRKVVGNLRRTDVGYAITLTNHTPRSATVTLRDHIPVSRHESITVKDFQASPAPDDRTDLGRLTWSLELKPGDKRRVEFSFRLEHTRGLNLAGWIDRPLPRTTAGAEPGDETW